MAAAVAGEEVEEVGVSEDSATWTLEKDLLVEVWQARPCFYIISSDYSNRNKKAKAWAKIASELEMTGE